MSALRVSVGQWLEAVKETKLYDLLAATQALTQQLELAWLMAQTDVTAMDAVFVTRLISNLAIMGFVAVLIVFLVVRRQPKARAPMVVSLPCLGAF